MEKCTCRKCGGTNWEISQIQSYTFWFTCINCEDMFEMISLVDLTNRCVEEEQSNV